MNRYIETTGYHLTAEALTIRRPYSARLRKRTVSTVRTHFTGRMHETHSTIVFHTTSVDIIWATSQSTPTSVPRDTQSLSQNRNVRRRPRIILHDLPKILQLLSANRRVRLDHASCSRSVLVGPEDLRDQRIGLLHAVASLRRCWIIGIICRTLQWVRRRERCHVRIHGATGGPLKAAYTLA